MPVTVSGSPYDLMVVTGDGRELYLRELLKSLTRQESIDEAAQRVKTTLHAPESKDLAAWLRGSRQALLTGIPFGAADPAELWRGVVWDVQRTIQRAPSIPATFYDHMIYTAKNEDEFYYEAGQTATAIIRDSAARWGIPIGPLADTGVALKRQVQRGATLWKMWTDALHETAKLGGGLFRLRMTSGRLELVKLGSNQTVWLLEIGANILDAEESWSRDQEVKKAKVVGQTSSDTAPRPVLAIYEDPSSKTTGTIQKVVSDPDVKTAGAAIELARQTVRGPQESMTIQAPDINTLRAGDAVVVRDETGADYRLIVDSVEHDHSRAPGTMSLTLTTEQQIRWRWIS